MSLLETKVFKLPSRPKKIENDIDCDFDQHMAADEDFKAFIRDVESGKIMRFSWDADIAYEEFKKRVLAGHYDEK